MSYRDIITEVALVLFEYSPIPLARQLISQITWSNRKKRSKKSKAKMLFNTGALSKLNATQKQALALNELNKKHVERLCVKSMRKAYCLTIHLNTSTKMATEGKS